METIELIELTENEMKQIDGGISSNDVAYGVVSSLAFMYGGALGWAYVTYNYVKD